MLIGYSINIVPAQAQPQTIIIPEPQIIYQEKIVEVPIKTELRNFETLDTLKEWLNGITIIVTQENMCGEVAQILQDKAEKDGYRLDCIVIENGKLYGKTVSNITKPHMGNMAIIDKLLYYIEPQTDEVTLFGRIR